MTYAELTEQELDLYKKKNADYARNGRQHGNFERVAAILSNYPNLRLSDTRVVCLTYLLKQLDAALWMINQNYDGQVETIDSRLTDVHVYAKICRLLNQQ